MNGRNATWHVKVRENLSSSGSEQNPHIRRDENHRDESQFLARQARQMVSQQQVILLLFSTSWGATCFNIFKFPALGMFWGKKMFWARFEKRAGNDTHNFGYYRKEIHLWNMKIPLSWNASQLIESCWRPLDFADERHIKGDLHCPLRDISHGITKGDHGPTGHYLHQPFRF